MTKCQQCRSEVDKDAETMVHDPFYGGPICEACDKENKADLGDDYLDNLG